MVDMRTFRRRARRERSDAHIVIQREFVASEHIWPRIAVSFHASFAAVSNTFAEPATWIDGPIEAHGTRRRTEKVTSSLYVFFVKDNLNGCLPKERAEEELGVSMAADVEKWDP